MAETNKYGEMLCEHTWLPEHSCAHCQRLPWEAEIIA